MLMISIIMLTYSQVIYYRGLVNMYVCMYGVITTLLVLPGGLGRAFHPSLYRANNFAPYYTTYTGTNQTDKDSLGSFHGDIRLNVTL